MRCNFCQEPIENNHRYFKFLYVNDGGEDHLEVSYCCSNCASKKEIYSVYWHDNIKEYGNVAKSEGCGKMFEPFGKSPPETSWKCGDEWNGKSLLCSKCKEVAKSEPSVSAEIKKELDKDY